MANRPSYFIKDGKITERGFEFQWFAGFAPSQKQKSIASLHSAIKAAYPAAKPLEISTKGLDPLGVKLSAFNLKLDGCPLECVFQSSKVFDDGTDKPHTEWLTLHPKEVKAAAGALHKQGIKLTGFSYNGTDFPLTPTTAFYDYIYIDAVRQSLTEDEITHIKEYDFFTDIEFNPNRSLNTQARTAALIKQMLTDFGTLPKLSAEDFIAYHKGHIKDVRKPK